MSCQIDHILVNPNGVFVIETKNYSGDIYGSDEQREWTRVLAYGKVKNKIYNPVKQNNTHLYRLRKILPKDFPLVSVVVFVQNNTQHINSKPYTVFTIKLKQIAELLYLLSKCKKRQNYYTTRKQLK